MIDVSPVCGDAGRRIAAVRASCDSQRARIFAVAAALFAMVMAVTPAYALSPYQQNQIAHAAQERARMTAMAAARALTATNSLAAGNFYSGVNIEGTQTINGTSSLRLSGDVTPSTPFAAVSITDVQRLLPSSTATFVGGMQMLTTIGACSLCGTTGDPSLFGTFLYGGHITYDSSYVGPNPLPAEWDVNPAKPTWNISVPILDHVYYALPGGANSCEPSGVTITVKCEGISVGSFPDIPGAGGTMTITSGVFNVPNGSPNQSGSTLNARAIQIGGNAGTASGGAVVHAFGILETSTALNKFAGDLQSNDTYGWYLDSGVDCDSGTAVIQPSKAMPASGMGCHDHTASNWNMSSAGVEDLWGNNTGITIPVKATFSDNVIFTGIATTPGGAQPLCIGVAGTIFRGSGGSC